MNIFEAAENGDIERIKNLLDEGVDINIKNKKGSFKFSGRYRLYRNN